MKKNIPSLSILLLTYNSIENTKRCIDALYKHTTDFNLIIVDNASSDGTPEYLRKIRSGKDIIMSYQKENLGIVKGRNHAYKRISYNLFPSAKYIFFLDNDQEVLPGWQENYMEFFEQGYDIVGTEAWRMREKDFYPYERLKDGKKDSWFSYVGCGGMMIKREVIEDIGLFDERYYQFFEDPHFCWTAHESGYKIGWNYNLIIVHHHQGSLLSKKTRQYFTDSWKKFQKEWMGKKIPPFLM